MTDAGSNAHEIAGFLARHPPFDTLDEAELDAVAAAVERRGYRAGDAVLVEDGKPAQAFYVIRDGSMELVHDEEVIDILEPGEGFGHPSLLTGLAPAFTIRAHEDSTCYVVPRDLAISVLGRPAGAGFVARTLRERLTRTGHVVHGLPQLATVRVGELIVQPPRNVRGIVSSADLMGLETYSPFALRHAVLQAADEDELAQAAARLPRLFLSLLDAGAAPADVGRVLSLQLDALTTRLIDFSIWRHGPAPAAWAWIVLGSAARRELTLGSDQENALAYAGSDDPAVDAYFARFGAEVGAGLARCGFRPDPNEVVAGNRLWRMPGDAWLQVFRDCLEAPDRSHLLRATVAFDFRHGGGGLEVVAPLVQILRTAPSHADFVRRLARTATDFTPPLGFRGSLVVEREGAESGKLDIKRGGILPIVNLARFHALAKGITISGTLARLAAAREAGALGPEVAASLLEALEIVWRIRLQHHAAKLEAGEPPDNLVDPGQLPPIARRELREAFRSVARAQKRL